MSSQKYTQLVANIFNLITFEMEKAEKSEDVAPIYPKLVIMYEFFRLLRGESFLKVRPETPDEQQRFYDMEDKLAKKLDLLKTRINFDDPKTQHYIEEIEKPYLK